MKNKLNEFAAAGHDANQGGGYGRIGKPKGAGTTWLKNTSFPYDEEVEEFDEDEEGVLDGPAIADRFVNKMSNHFYGGSKSGGRNQKRTDKSSFAHSSARGLGEATGMVPFPNMYKNRTATAGGTSPSVYKTRPGMKGGVGSKKGWSTRPPPLKHDEDMDNAYHLDDFLTDDEKALDKASKTHDRLVKEFKQLIRRISTESK